MNHQMIPKVLTPGSLFEAISPRIPFPIGTIEILEMNFEPHPTCNSCTKECPNKKNKGIYELKLKIDTLWEEVTIVKLSTVGHSCNLIDSYKSQQQ